MTTLKAFLIWLSTSTGGLQPATADIDTGSTFELTDSGEQGEREAPPPASHAREKDDGGIYNGF